MLIFEYVPKAALKANIFMSFKQHIKIPRNTNVTVLELKILHCMRQAQIFKYFTNTNINKI